MSPPKDKILTGTNTQSQNRPGSNSNEMVLNTTQRSRTGTSQSDAIQCHAQNTHFFAGIQPAYFLGKV